MVGQVTQSESPLVCPTTPTLIDPLAATRGSFSAPTRRGPLAARRKPMAGKKVVKPKLPPRKPLCLFPQFDDRGFHPTLEFAFRVEDVLHRQLYQCWRNKVTDEPEWRPVPTLPADKLIPTTSTISSTDSPNSDAACTGKSPTGP